MLEPLHNTKNERASSLSNSVHITGCSPIWFVNSIYLAVLFCSFELICQSLQLIQPRCSQCRTFPSGTSALTALLAGQTAPRWAKILAPVEKNPQIPLAFVHVIVSIIANIVGGIVSAGVRGIDRRRSIVVDVVQLQVGAASGAPGNNSSRKAANFKISQPWKRNFKTSK